LHFKYALDEETVNVNVHTQSVVPSINWTLLSDEHVLYYRCEFSETVDLYSEKVLQNDDINSAISMVTCAILDSSAKTLPTVKSMSFLTPYWSDELGGSRQKLTVLRHVWCSNGRPRITDNVYCKDYKEAKHAFRKVHRSAVNAYLSKQDIELKKPQRLKQSFLEICKFQKRALEVATFNSVVYRDREQVTHQWKPFVRNLYTLSKSGEFDSD